MNGLEKNWLGGKKKGRVREKEREIEREREREMMIWSAKKGKKSISLFVA